MLPRGLASETTPFPFSPSEKPTCWGSLREDLWVLHLQYPVLSIWISSDFLFNKFSLQYQDMSPWGREREPLHVRVILSLWKFVDHGGLERRKAFRVTSKEEIGR